MITPSKMNTPVLFLIFNRIECTSRVFEAIRNAEPPRLYIAADGPRESSIEEAGIVSAVREIATNVSWSCEVKTLFREENLGCKKAVSSAIDWFFEHEQEGIILEDDCLPNQSFFWFCEELLSYYRHDERVWVITGDNFQNGIQRGDGSYYFSRFNHVWGWATWKRAWEKADMELSFWPKWKKSKDWKQILSDRSARRYWEKIFDKMHRGEIDTWDYPWTASVWYHGGLTATPNVNLVSNIGFGPDSTHTKSINSPVSNMPTGSLGKIKHPKLVVLDSKADNYVYGHLFGGYMRKFPFNLVLMPVRLLKYIE